MTGITEQRGAKICARKDFSELRTITFLPFPPAFSLRNSETLVRVVVDSFRPCSAFTEHPTNAVLCGQTWRYSGKRHRSSLLSGGCPGWLVRNEQESVCAVIKIKWGLTWRSALGWLVRKGPSEEVTLDNTPLLPLRNGGCCGCGSGTAAVKK